MKSKGFTLIELLAVIVILAIIALIAVPIVLNIIANSKEQSVKISAEHYFDAVEQAIAREYLKDPTINLDGTYSIEDEGKKIEQTNVEAGIDPKQIIVEYDGEAVDGGTVVIDEGKVTSAENMRINNYNVKLESGKIDVSKDDTPNGGESGTTKLAAGLYDENDNLITSWEDLISNGMINVSADGTTIERNSFSSIAGKLVISDNVTNIEYQAFSGCANLTEVYIPSSVISTGDYAFSHTGLTKVTIENGATNLGSSEFESCENLVEVNLPDSITSIGPQAFFSCSNLTSITIPSSVTNIGSSAFSWCYALTVTILGNNVTIDTTAFNGVPLVYYNGTVPSNRWGANQVLPFENGSQTPEIPEEPEEPEMPEEPAPDVPEVNESSEAGLYTSSGNFISWEDLVNNGTINVSADGTTINSGTSTSISGKLVISSDITSIGYEAFRGCASLTEVIIPNSVTTIESYGFNSCTSLTEITIPSSVTSIGDDAFGYCTSLIPTILGTNVTFGNYAFYESSIVYYAGYQEGVSYSSWCGGQVLPLQ